MWGTFIRHAYSTRTRTDILLGRTKFCQRGYGAAYGRRETKTGDSIELEHRNKRHGAPGGTGHLVACPLPGGASSFGLAGRPHDIGRTERAPPAALSGFVLACAAAGLVKEKYKGIEDDIINRLDIKKCFARPIVKAPLPQKKWQRRKAVSRQLLRGARPRP
jgi:hypothetical protein